MAVPAWLIISGGKFIMKKWLARKAKAAVTSATAVVAGGGLLGAGVWLSTNPDALAFLGDYQGIALAASGLLVAILRVRKS